MNYQEINRKTWNDKTDVHIDSAFYDMAAFRAGKNTLNSIELPLLGDVSGKRILHLQCHFGQDSLSLSRMGAKVTGIDISDKSIQRAKELSEELHLPATFIRSDVYNTLEHVSEKFDIVFASYGTIMWLPDVDKWASIIADSLNPGGRFVFAEFHPVIWMFDERFKEIVYSYFNEKPIIENVSGTYADRKAEIVERSVTWNHSLHEVIGALLKNGLQLKQLQEYDYSPYPIFGDVQEGNSGKYRISGYGSRLPLVYALEAVKA